MTRPRHFDDPEALLIAVKRALAGRAELAPETQKSLRNACRAVAEKVRRGELAPEQVDEEAVAAHLYTAGMPDPDLLVRTAGELRVSNYLLWQISYAELWVTETCWPDFTAETLHAACRDFAGRNRRFGGLNVVQGAV